MRTGSIKRILPVALVSGVLAALVTAPAASAATTRPNLYGVAPVGQTGMEVHALDGATTYDSWKIHAATPMDAMNAARWKFTFGDFNNDSIADLYMIDTTNKGITVLNGATNFGTRFGTWNLPATMASLANGDWRFRYATGDADGDGQDDLFLLDARDNAGQNTAIHVLDAGTQFSSFLAHRRVEGIGILDLGRWGFAVGDSDADARPDVYLLDSQDNGGQNTAVHILPANLGWVQFAAHRRIEGVAALDLKRWQFSVADYDGDKKADVYLMDPEDNGGQNTAVHLVSSASGWTKFSMHHRTAITQDLRQSIFPTFMAWAPPPAAPAPTGDVTMDDLRAIFGTLPGESTIQAGLPSLNAEMKRGGITTPARKAAFLATLWNESLLHYNAGQSGATSTYRGRGFIQLTGKGNYQSVTDDLGHDFVNNPDDAATITFSAAIARWYWTVARNINAAADRLDMGAVDDAIGYAEEAAEDAERCADFKAALQRFTGSVPSGINCVRP